MSVNKKKSATLAAPVRFTEFSFTSSNRECIGRKGMLQEKLKTINFLSSLLLFSCSEIINYFLVQNLYCR